MKKAMKRLCLFGLMMSLSAFGCGDDKDTSPNETPDMDDDGLAELCASHSALGFASHEACLDVFANTSGCRAPAQALIACQSAETQSATSTTECTLDTISHQDICWDDYYECLNETDEDAFDLCADAALDKVEACQNELLKNCQNENQGNTSDLEPTDSCQSEDQILQNCFKISELH